MFVRITAIFFLVMSCTIGLKAQADYSTEYAIADMVVTTLPTKGEDKNVLIPYRIKSKNTLFGIAQFFKIAPFSLKAANPQINHVGLQPGDQIMIPIAKTRISQTPSKVTLLYHVDKKDTWYGISKRQLGVDPSVIQKHNQEMGPVLRPGQKIIIGYLNLNAVSPPHIAESEEIPVTASSPSQPTDTVFHAQNWMPVQYSMRNTFEQQGGDRTVRQMQGKAIWRGGSSDDAFYVLHPSAAIGSIIEIHNPMLRTKLYAKVIGRIPAKAYPHDVQLVVSASVARHLGVLDPQFFAKTRFVEGARL